MNYWCVSLCKTESTDQFSDVEALSLCMLGGAGETQVGGLMLCFLGVDSFMGGGDSSTRSIAGEVKRRDV